MDAMGDESHQTSSHNGHNDEAQVQVQETRSATRSESRARTSTESRPQTSTESRPHTRSDSRPQTRTASRPQTRSESRTQMKSAASSRVSTAGHAHSMWRSRGVDDLSVISETISEISLNVRDHDDDHDEVHPGTAEKPPAFGQYQINQSHDLGSSITHGNVQKRPETVSASFGDNQTNSSRYNLLKVNRSRNNNRSLESALRIHKVPINSDATTDQALMPRTNKTKYLMSNNKSKNSVPLLGDRAMRKAELSLTDNILAWDNAPLTGTEELHVHPAKGQHGPQYEYVDITTSIPLLDKSRGNSATNWFRGEHTPIVEHTRPDQNDIHLPTVDNILSADLGDGYNLKSRRTHAQETNNRVRHQEHGQSQAWRTLPMQSELDKYVEWISTSKGRKTQFGPSRHNVSNRGGPIGKPNHFT